MHFGKNLNNLWEKGFSYLQILALSSALSAVVILSQKLSLEQQKAISNLGLEMEMSYIKKEIELLLVSHKNCFETFNGITTQDTAIKGIMQITFKNGEELRTMRYKAQERFSLGQENLRIKKFSHEKPKADGIFNLSIHFTVKGENENKVEMIEKIPISMALSQDGKLSKCYFKYDDDTKKWGTDLEGNVQIPNLFLGVGVEDPMASLHIKSKVMFAAIKLPDCNEDSLGTIANDREKNKLVYCNSIKQWQQLFPLQPSIIKHSINFEIANMGLESIKEVINQRICFISGVYSRDGLGVCLLNKNPANVTSWNLTANAKQSKFQAKCEVTCYE